MSARFLKEIDQSKVEGCLRAICEFAEDQFRGLTLEHADQFADGEIQAIALGAEAEARKTVQVILFKRSVRHHRKLENPEPERRHHACND